MGPLQFCAKMKNRDIAHRIALWKPIVCLIFHKTFTTEQSWTWDSQDRMEVGPPATKQHVSPALTCSLVWSAVKYSFAMHTTILSGLEYCRINKSNNIMHASISFTVDLVHSLTRHIRDYHHIIPCGSALHVEATYIHFEHHAPHYSASEEIIQRRSIPVLPKLGVLCRVLDADTRCMHAYASMTWTRR